MKHTPGPWHIYGPFQTGFSSKYYGVGNAKEEVCKTGGDMEVKMPEDLEKQKANAQLISAAPEMLELLEEIESNWDHVRVGDLAYINLKNVIAKARGET